MGKNIVFGNSENKLFLWNNMMILSLYDAKKLKTNYTLFLKK
jgi:hypothetical protein